MISEEEKFERWKEFEPNLEVADIVLIHKNKGPIVNTIQKLSKSYWNHVGLIFFTPEKKHEFRNYLIIEANSKGIEIHRIQKYTHNFDKYDLGVKRIPGLTKEKRQKILAYMLNYLDTPYDHTRLFGFFIRSFLSKFFIKYKHKLIKKDEFICSSFTQKAVYQAFSPEQYKKAMFKEVIGDNLDLRSLEEVSPGDISRSKNCEWIYNPKKIN